MDPGFERDLATNALTPPPLQFWVLTAVSTSTPACRSRPMDRCANSALNTFRRSPIY